MNFYTKLLIMVIKKKDGSHDHRYNKGNDRTPAQKRGDKKRRKKVRNH